MMNLNHAFLDCFVTLNMKIEATLNKWVKFVPLRSTGLAAKNWKSLAELYIQVFDRSVKPPERNLGLALS